MKLFKFNGCLQKSGESGSLIKGFASMNSPDREEDLIPPESFNISQFMANPQLMINHDFTYDEKGNQRTVGKISFATVAKVTDAGEVWDVIEISTGEKIDTLSKERLPNGTSGLRGLFVRAEVTFPDAQEMVESGELNSFSWRGLVRMAKVVINNIENVIATAIDIMEVSLVHIPCNYNSTFEIAKGIKGDDTVVAMKSLMEEVESAPLQVLSISFSSDIFTDESAQEWLKNNGFEVSPLSNAGSELHYRVSVDDYEVSETLSFQYGKGIQVIVAKEKSYQTLVKAQKNTSSETSEATNIFTSWRSEMKIKFTEDNWSSLQDLFKSLASIEGESFEEIPSEGSQIFGVLKQLSDFFTAPADVEFSDLVKSLSTDVTDSVIKTLDPTVQALTQSVADLTETLSKSATDIVEEEEVEEPEAEPEVTVEVPTEKAAPTKQAQLATALSGLFNRLEKAEEDLANVSKSVATPSNRDTGEGSATDTHPNSVFPTGWPFTGK